jgi:hypothetical protein
MGTLDFDKRISKLFKQINTSYGLSNYNEAKIRATENVIRTQRDIEQHLELN